MFLVAGSEDPAWFLESGSLGAESIRATLEKNGQRLEDLRAVLDFGCGIGRVIRHFHDVKGPAFHGICATFHPEAYVRATLAKGLDVYSTRLRAR